MKTNRGVVSGLFLSGLMAAVSACASAAPTVQVVASLTPVDASRPFFVYRPVSGTACGENAVAGAMDDLYRVGGDAHGFVSATIEQRERCVTITARPISYGCTPNEPKKLDVYPVHVVPGPTECSAAVDACTPECTRFSSALGGAEFETKAFRERCVGRCRKADSAFLTCARSAVAAADVRRCDALP